jgi:predicted peptidase
MRLTVLFILFFLSLNVFSQKLESIDGNSFYSISDSSNKKTIIFLHGGVNNPYFDQAADNISLDYLLEKKQDFITQASLNGFNLIVPITNDSLNWIDNPKKAFIELKKMVSQSIDTYEEIYISGFSDGGTGSFKIFYQNPDYFDGLIVFNGYPQHKNFHTTIDYKTITNKKILFFSTDKDKVIPYEFLLTEYCSQKKNNPNTFFYLSSGDHRFTNYTLDDIKNLFDILSGKNQNTLTEPIQGFIKNDQLVVLYPFRKKIVKKYNFGKEVYEANLAQHKK